MESVSAITLVLIICNFIFSFYGFMKSHIIDSYKFNVDSILIDKEYQRIITSGFLHIGWIHFAINMILLFAFSQSLELFFSPVKYLVIYFASLIVGNLVTLFIHRKNGSYSSVGAFDAVCGVMVSSVVLFPQIEIGLLGLHLSIPGWLIAMAYVLYTIYGIKSTLNNIVHDAYLGGVLTGVIITLLFFPEALNHNYVTIMLILMSSVAFIFIILYKPYEVTTDSVGTSEGMTIDEKYNHRKKLKQDEIDRILDKINRDGYDNLTQREKATLKEFEQR